MVDTLACSGIFNASNITGRSPHILVFAKEHRDVLSRAGWDKRRIREYIAENTVISEEAFRRAGGVASGPMRLIEATHQLLIFVAGGHAVRFAGVIPCWSWQRQQVTVSSLALSEDRKRTRLNSMFYCET